MTTDPESRIANPVSAHRVSQVTNRSMRPGDGRGHQSRRRRSGALQGADGAGGCDCSARRSASAGSGDPPCIQAKAVGQFMRDPGSRITDPESRILAFSISHRGSRISHPGIQISHRESRPLPGRCRSRDRLLQVGVGVDGETVGRDLAGEHRAAVQDHGPGRCEDRSGDRCGTVGGQSSGRNLDR